MDEQSILNDNKIKKSKNKKNYLKEMPKSGYLCRGRVKQKAQKKVDLINVGELKYLIN